MDDGWRTKKYIFQKFCKAMMKVQTVNFGKQDVIKPLW